MVAAQAPSPFQARPLKVLIVDDSRDAASTLGFLLGAEGYEVRAAYDGDAALSLVADFDPDVVIADIKMPGRSGWEVAKAVRKDHDEQRPLMIAVSGHYNKGSDRVLSTMTGFDYFLVKPVDPQALLDLLAQHRDRLLRES